MMQLAPAVIVHGTADVRAALAPGLPVTLVSAPGAALYAGAGWWVALILVARSAHPGRRFDDILDCGDAPGRAAEALRAGARSLVLSPAWPAAYERVRLMAEELGATLRPAMPPALDIGLPGARRRLAAWLAGSAPPAQGDNEGGFR
jgi:hypothetical protein